MKSVYIRNTGRKMCRMSFIDDQKVIDKLEKVSKRKMVSQSQVIRDCIKEGLREWDCKKTRRSRKGFVGVNCGVNY